MKPRVLLVGDADEQLEDLHLELQEAGFLVETASDGMEGLEVGFWFQPHLVVTEVELSGFSGFELSLRIASGQAGFSAKVIFYARSYRDEKSRQATCSKYGAVGYFVKPAHKYALLKRVIGMLKSIDLEGSATVVLPPFPKSSRQTRSSQQFQLTPDQLDAALSRNYSLIVRPEERAEPAQLQAISPEGESGNTESGTSAATALAVRTQLSAPEQEQEVETDVKQTENLPPEETQRALALPGDTLPEKALPAKIQPEPPLDEPAEALIPWIRDGREVIGRSKQQFSRAAKMLFAASAAVLILGVSLSLWLSRSLVLEVSPKASAPQAPDQISSLKRGTTPASPAPVTPVQPGQPMDPASEAMIRLLSAGSAKAGDQTQTIVPRRGAVRSSASSRELPSSNRSYQVVISDVSRSDQQPFLNMSRPSLSQAEIRAMGRRSYVVSVELDPSGKVKNARLMTSNAEGSFPKQILDAVRQWRFVPRDKSQPGSWVKYFTFKAQTPGP